jgi:hypothetical protein
VELTVTDNNDNVSSCTATVTVEDNIAPTITGCSSDMTVNTIAGDCSRLVALSVPVIDDNCDMTLTVVCSAPGSDIINNELGLFPVGTSTVMCIVTDAAGNADTCSFDITVVDAEAPTITGCPSADIVVNNDVGECGAFVPYGIITASDNCPGVTLSPVSGHLVDGDDFIVGTTPVEFVATDAGGTMSTCAFNVVVNDTEDPATPTLADVTGECEATATAPTTTDNCGPVTGTTSDPLTYTDQGTYTITWTFDDGNDNIIMVDQTVIVDDVSDPATPTLANVTGECSATATAPITTDNCAGNITGTTSDPLSYTDQGTYTITWTFDDGNDNIIMVDQTVIVDDVSDPATPTLANVTGECSATATAPITTDNCAGNITGTTSDPLTYTDQGTYTITWTFDDGNDNVIMVDQTVIVDDVTNPDTPTLADVTGDCDATVTAPTTTDNCSGTITGTTTDPVTYTDQGTYTITWTFDDGNGNAIMVDQTVIVDDTEAPMITCAGDISVNNDLDECSAYVTVTAPVVTDNCYSDNAPAGTEADPFTSLAQAGSVFGAGTFFFDVDGNQFSTFVECGWIMIASSPSTATTDLTITSNVTPQSNSILPPAVYADLSIERLRINATGGPNLPFDVETDNPAVLANLASNVILHNGVVGGANEWTGVGANRMIVPCNGSQTPNFTLDRGIFQACGNGSGLHWAPTIAQGGPQPWVSVDFQSGTNDIYLWAQVAAPVLSLTHEDSISCAAAAV